MSPLGKLPDTEDPNGQIGELAREVRTFDQHRLIYSDDTILQYTVLYYITLYYSILYYTILYYTIQYYTMLYYTIL